MFSRDAGDSVMFQCRAIGVPLPEVVWLKDGMPLIIGSKYQVNSGISVNSDGLPTFLSFLTVSSLNPRDAGDYNCRAFNNLSSISLEMPYDLTVIPAIIDYCTPDPCQNGGRCTFGVETFVCHCTDGYTGITCDQGEYVLCQSLQS